MNERYLDAQVSVLGSILIDDTVAAKVIHRTREEDYTGSYRTIYRTVKEIFLAGRPVDLTTISAALGPDYDKILLQIMELTPSAAQVDVYIDLALEQAQLARLKAAGEALQNCKSLDDARAVVGKINRSMGDRPSVRIVTMAQGVQDFYDRQNTKPEIHEWGLGKLDGTVMAERGDFIIVGGYPSAGKTALSLQLAWNQAEKRRVGYFSLETKPEKLIDRAFATVAGIDFKRIKKHTLVQEDWLLAKKFASDMSKRTLEVIQAGGLSVADIQALALAGRYEIIYIDYLQLVRAEDQRRTDFEQVSQISRDLHTLAQTTGITVVALSQLTRPETVKGKEKAPTLHSLRQSGQIEQDADAVMLLYKENSEDPVSRRCLKVAKNKEGVSGGILLLHFDGSRQHFSPVENTSQAAKKYAAHGKAVKQANRSRQTSFYEMPSDDEDIPHQWKEDSHDPGASSTAES